MLEGDEFEPLAGGVLDKPFSMRAPKGADAPVGAGHRGNLINPEDRKPVHQLAAALWFQILDKPLEFKGWDVTQQIRDLPRERSCSQDQYRAGRARVARHESNHSGCD